MPAAGAATLRNPEPNFYILGAKSYGRNSNFLLRTGFEQVRDVFTLITGEGGAGSVQEEMTLSAKPQTVIMAYPAADPRRCPRRRSPCAHLDDLWFQVAGTLCNLDCTHCFISCSPHNHTFGFLDLATVRRVLDESVALGVKEYYFTGGEPFLNRDMVGRSWN